MKVRRTRVARWAAFALLIGALSVVAAGCAAVTITRAATGSSWTASVRSVNDIQANAEGQVNIIVWSGYAEDAWVKPFEEQTGWKVT